jgi:hypothetical protein
VAGDREVVMGGGRYDYEEHQAATTERAGLKTEQVFAQNACHPDLDPKGVRWRESRDSANHPDSVGIVFALDVSGSMGEIPVQLAMKTMPSFMQSVLTVLPDAQVMFMALGCAYGDKSPIQVGQFESESALIDKWLGMLHLEGGGSWRGESYDLAMYVAARHTAMDCLERRKRRGYFFMTGDEVFFMHLTPATVAQWIGDVVPADIRIEDLTDELTERFRTFFLIPDAERAKSDGCEPAWRLLLGDCTIVLGAPADTAIVASLLVGICEGQLPDAAAIERKVEALGYHGAERDRIVRAVVPYAEAVARGGGEAPRGPRGLTQAPAERRDG